MENVLLNAVQHCRVGGEVWMAAEFEPLARRLRISIFDQGSGVPEADLQAIFQTFFKGRNQNRPEGGLQIEIALPLSDAA